MRPPRRVATGRAMPRRQRVERWRPRTRASERFPRHRAAGCACAAARRVDGAARLEVDDHPIAVGAAERLTEVQVAVVTGLLHTAEPGERLDEIRHAQSASRIAEGGVRTLDLIADRRIPCPEVGVGDGLRREVRVIRPSGERLVETARHLTETSDRVERRSSRAQLVEQPFPAVARTRDELLHDGEGGGAAVATPVLELTEEAGGTCGAPGVRA